MHWLFTPFDRHADDGFGEMASAFKASAETLVGAEKDAIAHRELPTCFLLRHAAELFLKSAVVVSHRAFVGGKNYPAIMVDGKARPMTNVHGLGPLYRTLVDLLTQHRVELEARARTEWLPMPVELDEAIDFIDSMDDRGVFFRYPTDSNSTKSPNKPITSDEISVWDKHQRGNLRAFLVMDQNDELVEAFHYEQGLLAEELEVLTKACYWLECIHVGLRMELAGGW